jgi:hypothetical protein
MPRTALITTLIALAVIAGAATLPKNPVAVAERASLAPLDMTIPGELPVSVRDSVD